MITVQDNIQSYIDKSGIDTIKIAYNDQIKILKRKGVSTIASENPFSFVVFSYKGSAVAYKAFDSNLDLLYTKSSGGTSYHFAVDRSDESFFALEGTTLVNRTKAGVSLNTNAIGVYVNPFVYDGTYLWGYVAYNRIVYRISKDLQTVDQWTLKAGVLGDSDITYITMSQDGSYVFIGCQNGQVGRFAATQAGITGDADWEYTTVADGGINQLCVDSSNNVYASGVSGDDSYTTKITAAGSLAYKIDYVGSRIQVTDDYIFVSGYGEDRLTQYDASDGSYIGRSIDLGTGTIGYAILCDSDFIIAAVGAANTTVYAFDASGDFDDGEASVDSVQIIGTGIICAALGDSAGLLNSKISSGSARCHGYEVDIKTKIKIEEIN